jgi:hypothetical protein
MHWYTHLVGSSRGQTFETRNISEHDGNEILTLLDSFLNDEEIVQQWSQSLPASFFTRVKAEITGLFISHCYRYADPDVLKMTKGIELARYEKWKQFWTPVWSVHGKNVLHGNWNSKTSLEILYQIYHIMCEKDAPNDSGKCPIRTRHN